jgi:uncharacterized RDD family membrane protein YckC
MQPYNPYAAPGAVQSDLKYFEADPRHSLADPWARFVANIVDSLFGVCMFVPAFLVGGLGGKGGNEAAVGAAFLLGAAVWIVVATYLALSGQSVGKKLLGLRVVRADGSPVGLLRLILLRNVANSLLGLIPFYGLVDALMIFGERRQCIHDRLADTLVVKVQG